MNRKQKLMVLIPVAGGLLFLACVEVSPVAGGVVR